MNKTDEKKNLKEAIEETKKAKSSREFFQAFKNLAKKEGFSIQDYCKRLKIVFNEDEQQQKIKAMNKVQASTLNRVKELEKEIKSSEKYTKANVLELYKLETENKAKDDEIEKGIGYMSELGKEAIKNANENKAKEEQITALKKKIEEKEQHINELHCFCDERVRKNPYITKVVEGKEKKDG